LLVGGRDASQASTDWSTGSSARARRASCRSRSAGTTTDAQGTLLEQFALGNPDGAPVTANHPTFPGTRSTPRSAPRFTSRSRWPGAARGHRRRSHDRGPAVPGGWRGPRSGTQGRRDRVAQLVRVVPERHHSADGMASPSAKMRFGSRGNASNFSRLERSARVAKRAVAERHGVRPTREGVFALPSWRWKDQRP